MKTEVELKAEIYNALFNDSALFTLTDGNIKWTDPVANQYPLVVYSMLDTTADYVLGGCVLRSHETIDVQVDTYVSTGNTGFDLTLLSDIVERIKVVMMGIGYMMIPGNPELIEGDKIQKVTRWRCLNV